MKRNNNMNRNFNQTPNPNFNGGNRPNYRNRDRNERYERNDRHESFNKNPEPEHEYKIKNYKKFEDIGLKENLIRGIFMYGFKAPSKIQGVAVKPMMEGYDMIAQSQNGTGKTGTFTIGVLQVVDETKNYPQAIILANTRELAEQIKLVTDELGKFMGVKTCICVGQTDLKKNIEECKKSQILIGTPGRLEDLLTRRAIDGSKIKIFVVDEADALLKFELKNNMRNIIGELSDDTQICFFSATLPRETIREAEYFTDKPLKLLIEKECLTLESVAQYKFNVKAEENKYLALEDLYGKFSINQCIIYVNSIEKAEQLKKQLTDNNFTVEMLHGKVDLVERSTILKNFRGAKFRVLIATDLLSRGIDIEQIGYVINYDLPPNPETYLHRIGRSGRFNKKGVAINFCSNRRDLYLIRDLEHYYKTTIPDMPDPNIINAYLTSSA